MPRLAGRAAKPQAGRGRKSDLTAGGAAAGARRRRRAAAAAARGGVWGGKLGGPKGALASEPAVRLHGGQAPGLRLALVTVMRPDRTAHS